jgi:hypothetical protein
MPLWVGVAEAEFAAEKVELGVFGQEAEHHIQR